MKTLRDYIDLISAQLNEAPDTVVPGGGSITTVDPNSAEGKAMIARSQAVQAGKSPDSAAPAPGQPATPAATTTPAAPAAKTWNKGVLGRGMKGPEVSALQKKLGIPETGTYDAATIAAVQALQKKLGVAADGAYGPGTKAAHDKMPQQAATPAPANAAAPGQPPSTAAKPELGTQKGATQAIPTSPVDPTNPSGVGAKADLTPQEIATKAGILTAPRDAQGNTTDATGTVYKKDLDWLQRFGANTQPAAVNNQSSGYTAQAQAQTPAPTTAPAPATAPPGQAAMSYAGNRAAPGETAGGAATARPVAPATGARAQMLQRQQAGNQMPESRDTPFQKQLNAMKRIAGLKDNGL